MTKEIDKENGVKIAFSGIIHRKDCDCKDMIDNTKKKKKKKIENYCAFVTIASIRTEMPMPIDRNRLHFNCKGSSVSSKNVNSCVKLKVN